MPVWLRRSLIVLAVLLGLAVAAVAWLVASFDPNRYKGLLIDWMREHKSRTLAIDGPISLSVFPRLELSLRDVKLSEHKKPAEFASLKEAALSIQLMPLLTSRQLAIGRVGASGVRVSYTRDADGRSSIDDLLGVAAPPAGGQGEAPAAGNALSFDVSRIELRDLQATVKDAKTGLDGRFIVQELVTGRLADGAESPVRFVGQAVLAQPLLNAQIELDGRLRLALPAGAPAGVSLAGMKLALRGEGFKVKQLDARLAGALAYDGASGALRADKLRLTLSGERLGMVLKDSSLALDALRFEPEQRALQLDALDLRLAGRSGDNAIDATLAWPRLEVTGDTLKGSALKGSASLKGVQTVKIEFESQAPSGSFERIRVPGVKLAVDGSGAGRTVRGEARTDLTLAPQPLAAALDALQLQLAFTDPALPPMKLALQGQAKAGAQDASWAVDGTINEQKFNVAGRADLAKAVPRIEAQARFAALDLTRFVAPPGGAKPAADKPAADPPIDLAGLKAIDGSFSLRAGSLVYPPYRVADAALDATLAGGMLRVSQLSGKAWNGRFNAQASADASAQRIGVKLDASDVDIAQLLGDVAQFKKLEGTGRVTADVTTRGASLGQFKQQLAGKAAFQLRDGAVRGINLAKVLRQWRSAVSLNQDAVQSARAEEKTDFSEISASFDIDSGVARSKDLVAKSPFLRVGGEGLVDIGKGRVDYTAQATVTGSSEGQGGADLAALKGVTVPVHLVGPFEAVDYKVQWSAVAAALLSNRAKEALNERTKGVFGGLLGTPSAAASGQRRVGAHHAEGAGQGGGEGEAQEAVGALRSRPHGDNRRMSDLTVTLASLHVHPIKSCAGVALDECLLIETGLEFDRAWMLVDRDGEFVSQRELPRMALVSCTLKHSELVLRAPGMLALHLTLDTVEQPTRVRVWDDEVAAYDMGNLAARWFSDFLRQELRLVRFDPEHKRLSNRAWTGAIEAENAFSDGYPLLVVSQASLDGLNERLAAKGQAPVTMQRFRPNLVLAGLDAHGEDHLDEIAFDTADGPVRLKLVKPCPRCPIPNIDPATGVPGTEPGDTLQTYRADQRVGGAISFGMNAVIVEGIERALRVGQTGRASIRF